MFSEKWLIHKRMKCNKSFNKGDIYVIVTNLEAAIL